MSVPKIHSGSFVCSVADLPFTRLHEDLWAFDQQAGYCYSMNPSAARIWELIPNFTPVSAVCAELCVEFGVDDEQCRQDVLAFLSSLAEAGLVRVAD